MIEALSNPYLGLIGLLTSIFGSVVVLSVLLIWATEQVIRLFGFKKALILAYQQHLENKRETHHGE